MCPQIRRLQQFNIANPRQCADLSDGRIFCVRSRIIRGIMPFHSCFRDINFLFPLPDTYAFRSETTCVPWPSPAAPRAGPDEMESPLRRHARAETPRRVTQRGPHCRGSLTQLRHCCVSMLIGPGAFIGEIALFLPGLPPPSRVRSIDFNRGRSNFEPGEAHT